VQEFHKAQDQSGAGRETDLLHAEADPLRKWGPARETHPEEWESALAEARDAGLR